MGKFKLKRTWSCIVKTNTEAGTTWLPELNPNGFSNPTNIDRSLNNFYKQREGGLEAKRGRQREGSLENAKCNAQNDNFINMYDDSLFHVPAC